jgi:hypothetical protein
MNREKFDKIVLATVDNPVIATNNFADKRIVVLRSDPSRLREIDEPFHHLDNI